MNGTPAYRYLARSRASMNGRLPACRSPNASEEYAHPRVSSVARAQPDWSTPRKAVSSATATCAKSPAPMAPASGYPTASWSCVPNSTGSVPKLRVSSGPSTRRERRRLAASAPRTPPQTAGRARTRGSKGARSSSGKVSCGTKRRRSARCASSTTSIAEAVRRSAYASRGTWDAALENPRETPAAMPVPSSAAPSIARPAPSAGRPHDICPSPGKRADSAGLQPSSANRARASVSRSRGGSSALLRTGCCAVAHARASENDAGGQRRHTAKRMPRRRPDAKAQRRRLRQRLRSCLDLGLGRALVAVARIGPEDVVPQRRGDAIPHGGRLEVMDEVVLAHPLPDRGAGHRVVQVVVRQVVPDVSGDQAREERVVQVHAQRRLEREPEQERDDRGHRGRHHQTVGVVGVVVVDAMDQPRGVALPLDPAVRLPVEDPAVQDVLEERPAEHAQREHAEERPARQLRIVRSVHEQPRRVRPPEEHHVPGAHAGEILLDPVDPEHPRASAARVIEVGTGNEVEHGGSWLSG